MFKIEGGESVLFEFTGQFCESLNKIKDLSRSESSIKINFVSIIVYHLQITLKIRCKRFTKEILDDDYKYTNVNDITNIERALRRLVGQNTNDIQTKLY